MDSDFNDLIPEVNNDHHRIIKMSGEIYLFEKVDGKEVGLINSPVWKDGSHDSLFGAAHVNKVLLAGLGLGYDTWKIRDYPEIETIHVVEKSQPLIELLAQYSENEKVTHIHDRILHHLQTTDHQYDLIWIDIFPEDICFFREEEVILREAAHSRLRPGGKILFWKRHPIQEL